MSRDSSNRRHGGIAFPLLVTALGLALLIGLGIWQLERKAWKDALVDALAARLAAPATALPARETWPRLEPRDAEFRRVAFPAELLHEHEALIYAVGSALRPDVSGPGFWVLTPARLTGGSLVMVNRGFVPEAKKAAAARADGQVGGTIDITGVLRWPEPRGTFTPADDPDRNIWYLRDHLAVADAKKLGAVAPFYVDMEAPNPPGGLPQAGPLRVNLPNNHLQYALTWFGLAATLLGIFVLWALRRRRPQRSGPAPV